MKLFTRSLSLVALLGIATVANAQVVTDNTPGNFDSSSGTRTLTIAPGDLIAGNNVISDVNISIEFAKADGQNFNRPYPTGTPFFNEVVLRLTSPDGGIVNLINAGSFNTGSGGPAFDGIITFDDSAANVVNVNVNLMQPGTFRPVAPLSALNGGAIAGNWTLFIQDTTGGDSLRYFSSTLTINNAGAAVPEPGSVALLVGAGIGGLMLRRRKK